MAAGAGRGGRAGTGYVEIRPELTRSFQRDLERMFEQATSKIRVKVPPLDTSGLRAQATKAGDEVGRSLGDSVRKASSGLGSSLLRGGAALGGGALAGLAIGKDLFESFSDLNEAANKAQVVFGGAFGRIQAMADGAAKAMGLSKMAALDAAGTFGGLFVAMGIGQEKSADMSLGILQLASDLASFNNVPVEDALMAIRSGLTGEIEPMRRFGVNLTQASIEAEAYRIGLVKANVDTVKLRKAQLDVTESQRNLTEVTKKYGPRSIEAAQAANKVAKAQQDVEKAMAGSNIELTAAQKAQASYSLIMQQTTVAQGDFARTSDGAANKQRVLAAELENTKARLGEALAPLANAALSTLTTGLDAFNNWWTEHGPGIQKWITDTFGTDPAASFQAGLAIVRQKLDDIGQWITTNIGTFDDFQRGLQIVKDQGIDPLVGTAQDLWVKFTQVGDWMREHVGDGADFVRGWGIVSDFFSGLKNNVLDPIIGTLQTIGSTLANLTDNELFKDVFGDRTGQVAGLFGIRLPAHDKGGTVAGPIGSPQVILAHGGETVLPTHRMSTTQAMSQVMPGGGGGTTVQGDVYLDGQKVGTVLAPVVERKMLASATARRG